MNSSDCVSLQSRADFKGYVDVLRNVTNGDFSLVGECRRQVCGALWGSGNPDISGIGMTIGYLLESIICAVILFALLLLKVFPQLDTGGARLVLSGAAKTFYDGAIFFTFAIQLASIITLAEANFGVSTEGMGAFTMKIAWLVSVLTLLPLLPFLLNPMVFVEKPYTAALDSSADSPSVTGEKGSTQTNHKSTAEKIRAREGQRFLMFVICWAMSFYSFFSRTAGTFGMLVLGTTVSRFFLPSIGKSEIGDFPGSAINNADWRVIERACFEGAEKLSSNSEAIMTGFGISSWLFVTVIVIYKIFLSAIKGLYERPWNWLKRHDLIFDYGTIRRAQIWSFVCVVVLTFLIGHFWAFFRLRTIQSDMVEAAGERYPDGQWTFGQIVAVIVFLPVVVEVVFLGTKRSLFC